MKSKPLALALYEQLSEWFGDTLTVWQQSDCPMSSAGFRFEHKEGSTRVFFILNLRIQDATAAAQIAHEMMHLDLIRRGLPLGIGFLNANCIGIRWQEVFDSFINPIQHELFFDDFLAMDFERNEFLVEERHEFGVTERENRMRKALENPVLKPHCRGLWNSLYLSEWIMRRQGFTSFSDEFRRAGSRLFPSTMEADAAFVRHWIDSGVFRRPAQYQAAVAELLAAIGLPKGDFRQVVRCNDQFLLD